MSCNQEKEKLRLWVKEKQKQLSDSYCKKADKIICERILRMEAYQKAETVFCFVGTEQEICTQSILEDSWKKKKHITVPRCAEEGIMHAYEIFSDHDLEKGHYGIYEPKENCSLFLPEEIDFAIIPCLSCDKQGHRLGHGKGYYDRYLRGQRFKTAVLCRQQLLVAQVPIDRYDCSVDWVVTEEGVYDTKSNA